MHVNYQRALLSLAVYRDLLRDDVIQALLALLKLTCRHQGEDLEVVGAYHEFLYRLLNTGRNFQQHLLDLIMHADNPFSKAAEIMPLNEISHTLLTATQRDLRLLQQVYHLDFKEIEQPDTNDISRFKFQNPGSDMPAGIEARLHCSSDWSKEIEVLAQHYVQHSRGLVSRYRALRWEAGRGLSGIEHPHLPSLEDIVGYDSQKQQICYNTDCFVKGLPANNVLLYGSRGTGKSTMIKAMVRQFWEGNLHIVEVNRSNLSHLNLLADELQAYRCPFIVFIDDLSFEDYETEYKELKAIMEGGLSPQPANVIIYATSNRRHLVKEYFVDRTGYGEEVHSQDSLQEKLSLADRFGLTITFPSPDRQTYLKIVETLAGLRGIDIDPELLRRKAVEWERTRHGPSGRTARQFIDSLGRDTLRY